MIPNNLYPNLQSGLEPLSAGTFISYICSVCTDENGVAIAVQVQDTPHPTYTNELGRAVVQTQMVEIGGLNGLNS